MTNEEIERILEGHKNWVNGKPDGFRANLQGADLRRADLQKADLQGVDLRGANLREANLREANLWGAGLRGANLQGADLREANLHGAKLHGAALHGANLRWADLHGATLWGADLHGADLHGAKLREADLRGVTALYLQCPETGSFTAYKKLNNNAIATLEIPEEAKRSSATTRKCRAEKVRVLKIERNGEEINSEMSAWWGLYEVGKETVADKWDCDRWNECSHGIHFFVTRAEAEEW